MHAKEEDAMLYPSIKNTALLFIVSVFFVGKVAAGPLKTGVPSVPTKSWYEMHKKQLIAGAILVGALGVIKLIRSKMLPARLVGVKVEIDPVTSRWFIRVAGEVFTRTDSFCVWIKPYAEGYVNDTGEVYRRTSDDFVSRPNELPLRDWYNKQSLPGMYNFVRISDARPIRVAVAKCFGIG